MKSIPKTNIYLYGAREESQNNYINIKTADPISLTFFSNFLSFDSRVLIFFVCCILSTEKYLVSHLFVIQKQAFRVVLQNYYSAILHRYFLGLWSASNQAEKLKQLGLWSFCLVASNDWSVYYLASSKSRTHYSIALKFSAVQLKWTLIKTVSAFFLIICRSLGI